MNDTQQKEAARQFAAYWKDKGYEKGESQPFWLSLLWCGIKKVDSLFSRIS